MQKPVVIEIELKKSASPPKIVKRLQHTEAAPPTLEAINSKLEKAEELRNQAKKLSNLTDERIQRVQERKSELEKEHSVKIEREIKAKIEQAQAKRTQQIETVVK